jgi:protein-S-isoprenylcysteine O-methyltransferase Ste14
MLLALKNLLFTVLVPGTVAVYGPLRLMRGMMPATGMVRGLAIVVLTVGASIYAWCVWDFATFGRGTPAPIDAPKRLVVRGLYRATRNPMYVGVLTVILGWAILYRSPALALYAFAVWGCFQSFVLFYEEPHLRRVFGAEYEAYRARVGRWLPRALHGPGRHGLP